MLSPVSTVADLERALSDWMEEKHEEGRGAHLGNCVFGAIKLLSPRVWGGLPDARALLADWNAAPAAHWPPLPLPLM